MKAIFDLAERGWFPDPIVRRGIRALCTTRLREEKRKRETDDEGLTAELLERMRNGPLAVGTDEANEQHYEVPAEFFHLMLGPHRKYSACYWPNPESSLVEAEQAALRMACERAELTDGMRVLELGCGWGSLSLWMAEQYPASTITAVSNSHGQRRYIEEQCKERGIENLTVVTSDLNDFCPGEEFDRVVSIEMFEHMRNYRELMRRIAWWLAPGGKLFVHIFCHRSYAYFYEPSGPSDWMAREFFTGGTMPSDDLLLQFQDDMRFAKQWRIGGDHYRRTLEAWLEKLDANRSEALNIMGRVYGRSEASMRLQRWRLFLLACSELFGYRDGGEWYVSHYLFERRDDVPRRQ
jgi:cyclopropane-fatty-acyl-phospholipid synthase